jgi:CRISPR-associated protein Csm4
MHVAADTLFSAVCSMWRLLYGLDALRNDLLSPFKEPAGAEPFFLTSAFPYASDVRLFPKPLAQFPNLKVPEDDNKVFRRVRFVSEKVFSSLASGIPTKFDRGNCINGGAVWITKEDGEQLSGLADELTGDPSLWKKAVVPRVTLDRISWSSTIWHFGKLILQDGCGLWFAVRFNPAYPGLRQKFEAALRLLGDEGLCGERGAGHGLFEVKGTKEQEIPSLGGAKHSVTLSPVFPKDEHQARLLTAVGSAYELSARRGWVTSPEAANLRRKVVWMLSEGSVLTQAPESFPGDLANVKPDDCSHEVWRYGYAFPAGVKI